MKAPLPILLLAVVRGEHYDEASHCLIVVDESFQSNRHLAASLFADPRCTNVIAKLSLHGRPHGHFGTFRALVERLTDGQKSDLDQEGYTLLDNDTMAAEILAGLSDPDEYLGLARMDYVHLNFYDYGFSFSGCEKHFSDENETPLIDFTALKALTDAIEPLPSSAC